MQDAATHATHPLRQPAGSKNLQCARRRPGGDKTRHPARALRRTRKPRWAFERRRRSRRRSLRLGRQKRQALGKHERKKTRGRKERQVWRRRIELQRRVAWHNVSNVKRAVLRAVRRNIERKLRILDLRRRREHGSTTRITHRSHCARRRRDKPRNHECRERHKHPSKLSPLHAGRSLAQNDATVQVPCIRSGASGGHLRSLRGPIPYRRGSFPGFISRRLRPKSPPMRAAKTSGARYALRKTPDASLPHA
jgi:hypothetical protein